MRAIRAVLFVIAMGAVASLVILFALNENDTQVKLISPLLTSGNNIGLNQWFPEVLGADSENPEITAKAALFVDTKSGQVLYAKNAHDKLPVASLTKVMTVIVALDHRNLDEKLLVPQRAADMEPDKMDLVTGEKLTVKELLYGVFLLSANDAAETLAEDTAGNRDEFVKLMNDKAEQLGMQDTHFVNPTGLDEDSGNTYSSAYDLVVLTRYAITKYPFLVDISSTEHIVLPATPEHQDYDMYSGINLLTTYPGVMGFKIGYTPEAGLTIITLARKNGHEVVGAILGTEDRRDETRTLLDYSFEQLRG